jgi:hypothetical protein
MLTQCGAVFSLMQRRTPRAPTHSLFISCSHSEMLTQLCQCGAVFSFCSAVGKDGRWACEFCAKVRHARHRICGYHFCEFRFKIHIFQTHAIFCPTFSCLFTVIPSLLDDRRTQRVCGSAARYCKFRYFFEITFHKKKSRNSPASCRGSVVSRTHHHIHHTLSNS